MQTLHKASPGVRIITASSGLLQPDDRVTLHWLRSSTHSPIDPDNPSYRHPLVSDAQFLNTLMDSDTQVILLGSIATPKYVGPLLEVFGPRLFFPSDFVGRGHVSRGSLLLRSARQEVQLTYTPVGTIALTTHGKTSK